MTQRKAPASVTLKHSAPAEFKLASGNSGKFTGYASVFGNVDSGGDVILPGAFKEIVRTRSGHVLVLYQHSAYDPIGKATVTQDSHGLLVDGELTLEDPVGARAYVQMKAGMLEGMSIGYDVRPGGSRTRQDGARELSDLRLWEASVVTWGMNDQARIEVVKSAMDCQNPRELEQLLRESLLLSNRKAKAAASVMWPILDSPDASDARPELLTGEKAQALAAELQSITRLISVKG